MIRRKSWFVVSSLALLACSSSSATSTDAGPGEHDSGHDAGRPRADAGHAKDADSRDTGTSPHDAGHDAAVVLPPPTKMDLLLVIDNSVTMADKQQLLAASLPAFLNGLLNPPCVDASGTPVPAAQQPGPTGTCPASTQRDFPALPDVHVGVISSSLGSFGANACPDVVPMGCPGATPDSTTNDHGHLLSRTDPCSGGVVPTYQSEGFIAWDPAMQLSPPGETQLGDGTAPGLVQSVQNLVLGAGNLGCAYASQNEAWYRFLVDPSPYATIALNGNTVVTTGTDSVLLQQRQDFLRPDSLLVIANLTDRTDGSLKETAEYPLFADLAVGGQPFHLPTATQACITVGPTSSCCASCGQQTPAGCTTDPTCTTTPLYSSATENIALRAFGLISHKARYGIEFFYPPSRYVRALTSLTVTDEQGSTADNPLFVGGKRDPSRVFYTAIVGVPWQLIARAHGGVPDLVNGVSALDATQVGGFKSSAELALDDAMGHSFWSDIAGAPESYVAALSPYMVESTVPRTGTDPITGSAMAPPGSATGTNAINGHEWTIAAPPGDIEYACVFPKVTAVDCSVAGVSCDCSAAASDNPLCDPNPNDSGNLTLQTRDKAYPGIKHLAIVEGLGAQGIAASLCPAEVADTTQPTYAYLPTAKTLIARLAPVLRGH